MPAPEKFAPRLAYSPTGDKGGPGWFYRDVDNNPGAQSMNQTWSVMRPRTGEKAFPIINHVKAGDVTNNMLGGGRAAFVPRHQSYEILWVEENRTIAEGATGTNNLAIQIRDDGAGASFTTATNLLAATAINLETTAKTGQRAAPDGTLDDRIINPGQTLWVGNAVDAETSGAAAEDYEGTVCIWVRPITVDRQDRITARLDVAADADIAATGYYLYINGPVRHKVVGIRMVNTVVQATAQAEYIQVERIQGTEALSGGDLLCGVTDLSTTDKVDEVQEGTVVTTSDVHILEPGDRVAFYGSNGAADPSAEATVEWAGTVVVELEPVDDYVDQVEEKYLTMNLVAGDDISTNGAILWIADDYYWTVTNIDVIVQVDETAVTNPSLMVERLRGGPNCFDGAPAGADAITEGDNLMAHQSIDADPADDSVQAGTVLTTTADGVNTSANDGLPINTLRKGDRLAVYITDDDSSDAPVAQSALEALVQVRLTRGNPGHIDA